MTTNNIHTAPKMLRTAMLLIAVLAFLSLQAQPLCHVVQYDEEDGVPSNRITQVLQDGQGFMWFSTWNGLCRFDGYAFQTFKPQVGDGCHMATDRIRNIGLRSDGNILCRVEGGFYYLFDTKTYRFCDLTDEEQQRARDEDLRNRKSRWIAEDGRFSWTDSHQTLWTLQKDGPLTSLVKGAQTASTHPVPALDNPSYAFADRQGNLWVLDHRRITLLRTDLARTQRLDIMPQTQVKCLFRDQKGRIWLTTRQDATVRVYTPELTLMGYLGSDGLLHQAYTTFAAPVYCAYQQQDGTLWLGSKPGGVFRMKETAEGRFHIDHLASLAAKEVYDMLEDGYGRLWVATMDRALCYTSEPQAVEPRFLTPMHYPQKGGQMMRRLHITPDNILVATTTDGLVVSQLKSQADEMLFLLHQRQPDRAESLSSSATMDVVEDGDGSLFISTESGGVNSIKMGDLLKEQPIFQHINVANHRLSSDIAQAQLMTDKGTLVVVGSHLVSIMDRKGRIRVLESHFFGSDYRMSEARPLLLDDGRCLFALNDGAFIITMEDMQHRTYSPRLVLTYLEVRGERKEVRGERKEVRGWWNAESLDTLTLQPQERSMTVHFAALDYQAPERISYAFRLQDDEEWHYIGHDRSATLLDLEPGDYLLEIRSTNADGEWQENSRRLTIIVEPTFWEAWYGQLLVILLVIAALAAIAYTLLYIRRIKRQQRETLEKYLNLIEVRGEKKEEREYSEPQNYPLTSYPSPLTSELDPMLERVMKFVEENISNSDVSVGDMAEAAAVSRSGLQRKLKQAMGVTPQDLLKEARIKQACRLLSETSKNISEIAYACGFSDPKYFSRSFRQSTGLSPTEYREIRDNR